MATGGGGGGAAADAEGVPLLPPMPSLSHAGSAVMASTRPAAANRYRRFTLAPVIASP